MKLTIIGGGNMGSSIAKGLVSGNMYKAEDITVVDIDEDVLKVLENALPGINTADSDYKCIETADVVILAVKPWLIEEVILEIKPRLDYEKQILISIASGITIEKMEKLLEKDSVEAPLPALFRLIPNTAIAIQESLTLVATGSYVEYRKEELVMDMFDALGKAILIDESKMQSCTALTSCGIAFLFRYIRAATLAGTEMGIPPKDAQEMLAYTMKGAADLLLSTGANPEDEIDKVTTPGGITIKGINELEANGFSNAIIKALKACK